MAITLDKGVASSTLSLTPLIDVVFLLLIFFLVATRFAEEDRELDVQLPTASEARPLTVQPLELFVGINHQGEYYVSGNVVSLLELEHIVRRAVENNPVNQSVVVRADRRVDLDFAVRVFDLCNRYSVSYTLDVQQE